MSITMDVCFLCTKDYNCVLVDDRIVSQVEYLLPEITIIKLGIPLRICSVCEGALYAFSKFKQLYLETSRRLEASIKSSGAPHTDRAPEVVYTTSDAIPERIEETCSSRQQNKNSKSFLNPIVVLHRVNELEYNSGVSENIEINSNTQSDCEDIIIKEEPLNETSQDREIYNSILENALKEKCDNNSINGSQTELITKENTSEDSAVPVEKTNEYSTSESTNNILKKEKIIKIRCKICNALFPGKNSLRYHMIKIHNHQKFHNSEPKTKHSTDSVNDKNNKTNQTDTNDTLEKKQKYQCNICKKLLLNKSFLTRHLREHALQCSVCHKLFNDKSNLNRHMRLHSGIKEYECEHCGKLFSQKSNLASHMRIHSPKKTFLCNICGQFFRQVAGLINHKKSHYEKNECYICQKSFSQKSVLVTHMKTHSDVKDFECKICRRLFKHKSSLDYHIKTHSGVQVFPCNICSKSFMHKTSLTLHMKVQSGIKEFECDICNKSFQHKKGLTKHMKIDCGVKDFLCDICGRSFVHRRTLLEHKKMNCAVKNFQCDVCSTSFIHRRSLIYHKKIHSTMNSSEEEVTCKSRLKK